MSPPGNGGTMLWNKLVRAIKNIWRPDTSTMAGIDIGTTKIAVVIADVISGNPKIRGVAIIPFNGALWSGTDKVAVTARAIASAIREASKAAGCSTLICVIGISDITTGKNTESLVRDKRQVSRSNVLSEVDDANDLTVPNDMTLLDQVVNRFSLDGMRKFDPQMQIEWSSLKVMTHTIMCRRTVYDVVTSACKQAKVKLKKLTSSELASASMFLTHEEKKQGVCLLDIGGEYTTMIVYENGALIYTASVPWAGNHLTSCIGLKLGIDKTEAEKVKIAYSEAGVMVENHRDHVIHGVLNDNMHELCRLLSCELQKTHKEYLKAGIVLTGGTSRLPSIIDIFENVFGLPVRIAQFPDEIWLRDIPLEYASAVGLVLMGAPSNVSL